MKKRITLTLSLLLVSVLALTACGGGAKASAETFLNGIKEVNIEKMKSVCVEELHSQVEMTVQGMAIIKSMGTNFKFEYSDLKVEENGDEATVTFKIKAEMAGEKREDNGGLKLKKIDGKWLISEFTTV